MESEKMAEETQVELYPASVVKVLDEYTVVINRGREHGVSKGDYFLVYCVDSEELTDPETGESLGHLEIVRGTGSVIHVQQKISTLKSIKTDYKNIVRKITHPGLGLGGFIGSRYSQKETVEEAEKTELPFDEAEIRDSVKPV